MTMTGETTPPIGDAAASASVAESLSAVGYGLFALLAQGPLDQIQPMQAIREQARVDAVIAAADAAAYAPDAAAGAAGAVQDSAFGQATFGPDFDAITRQAPAEADLVPAAAATGEPTGTVDPTVSQIAEAAAATEPEPENPFPGVPVVSDAIDLPDAPAYKGGTSTLQMLQEISFLDE